MLLSGASSPLSVASQYANDTSLVVITTDTIKAVFETYAVFALGSDSRLKQVKSKGLWLGSWCGRVDTPGRSSDLVRCRFDPSSSMSPSRTRFPSVLYLLEG